MFLMKFIFCQSPPPHHQRLASVMQMLHHAQHQSPHTIYGHDVSGL